MANQNISRLAGRHKKRNICVFQTDLDWDEIVTSADVYQLAELPSEIVVTACRILVITAFDTATVATVDIGFDGDATLLDDSNLKATAGTNDESSLTPIHKPTGGTLTATPTLTGAAATVGKAKLMVEYIEYEQATGEMTNFVA